MLDDEGGLKDVMKEIHKEVGSGDEAQKAKWDGKLNPNWTRVDLDRANSNRKCSMVTLG